MSGDKVKQLPTAEAPAGSGAPAAEAIPPEGIGLTQGEVLAKVGELYLLRDKLSEKVTQLEKENLELKIELQNLKQAKGAQHDK